MKDAFAVVVIFGFGMLTCGLMDAAKHSPIEWGVNAMCSIVGVWAYLAFGRDR